MAAKQIGQYFKTQGEQGGASEGSAQHLIAHGLLAGAVAVAGGNNALSAATSAMSAEAAAPLLANYLYGKEANTLTSDEKTTITSITSIIGAGVGASTGSNVNIAQGAQSVQNAVENNYLTEVSVQRLKDCLNGTTCKTEHEKQSKLEESEKLSQFLDQELANLCAASPTADACRTGISTAIKYIAMRDAWEYLNNDVSRSSKQTFDYLYNSPNADKRLVTYMNTIDTRADFFGASNQYEQHEGSGAKWFGGAEFVSRATFTGLGADGNGSYITFALGKLLGNPPLYEWRKEAGDSLIAGGFENFKNLYNNKQDAVAWDIDQLKSEQKLLQPVHEKYLWDSDFFIDVSKSLTDDRPLGLFDNVLDERQTQKNGIDLLNYKSRILYGCKLLGYSQDQGCIP